MKFLFLGLLITQITWAKPTVLVSFFDPFGKAPVNNSETVANLLVAKSANLPFEIKLCKVQTKFDVSVEELRDCIAALPERPILVVSLGETGCDVKIETLGRNLDRTRGADNAGVERKNSPIVEGADAAVGFTYPLPNMYCALPEANRKALIVSNNAGSFVCNNLAYQMAWFETDLNFGFIHVPDHSCRNLAAKNQLAVETLLTMLDGGVKASLARTELVRFPVKKTELESFRRRYDKDDKCLSDFYKRARGFDEKSLWGR